MDRSNIDNSWNREKLVLAAVYRSLAGKINQLLLPVKWSLNQFLVSLLPRPKLCLGERYCFTRVSLWFCLSVCLWFRDQDSSKSSRPISMKFGRTLGYYKRKVKFEFDKNYFGRTRTSSSWILKIGISQKVISEYLLNFTK